MQDVGAGETAHLKSETLAAQVVCGALSGCSMLARRRSREENHCAQAVADDESHREAAAIETAASAVIMCVYVLLCVKVCVRH